MNLEEYKNLALRTESKIDKIVCNKNELNHLLAAFITIADILDGLKKKIYYSNPKKYNEKFHEAAEKLKFFTQCSDRHHDDHLDDEIEIDPRIMHGLLGNCTESGELAEHLMHMINGTPTDKHGIVEEIADQHWYDAILFDSLDMSWEQGLINNIDKLKARFPDGYSDYHAEHRNLNTERKILETNGSARNNK